MISAEPQGTFRGQKEEPGKDREENGSSKESQTIVFSVGTKGKKVGRSLVSGRLSRFDVGKSHTFSHHKIIDDLGERAFSREEQSS